MRMIVVVLAVIIGDKLEHIFMLTKLLSLAESLLCYGRLREMVNNFHEVEKTMLPSGIEPETFCVLYIYSGKRLGLHKYD